MLDSNKDGQKRDAMKCIIGVSRACVQCIAVHVCWQQMMGVSVEIQVTLCEYVLSFISMTCLAPHVTLPNPSPLFSIPHSSPLSLSPLSPISLPSLSSLSLFPLSLPSLSSLSLFPPPSLSLSLPSLSLSLSSLSPISLPFLSPHCR